MDNGLTKRDTDTIQAIFEKYPEVKRVCVFGSRAKGSQKNGSDVDLAILNEGISYSNLIRLKSDFEDSNLPYAVDVVYYPGIHLNELKEHIDRVGKLFYERRSSVVHVGSQS